MDHLFVFEGDGIVRDFPGNYTQYRIWLKEQEDSGGSKQLSFGSELSGDSKNEAEAAARKKMSFKEKREFELLEKEMPALEDEKKTITEKMSTGNLPYNEINELSDRMIVITRLLEEKELRWLELSEMY